MSTVEKSIDVNVPVSTAYNQWTQFEEFPRFMEGVEEVQQLDNKRLHWRAEIAGKQKEWDAEIVEQEPDRRVAWRNITGAENAGTVTFEPIDANRTRVTLLMSYDPEGLLENLGDALGFVSRRVEGDLERFKEFVESRGTETGAWRGEIHGAQETSGGTGTTAATAGTTGSGAAIGSATDYGTSGTTTDYTTTGGTTGGTTDYTSSTGGTTGTAYGSTTGTTSTQEGEVAIPVVEEDVRLGKREVESGGVQVSTRVEETPVQEQVNLREERVDVERRPVDRPASEADFSAAQQGTLEVRERREEPVVEKQARVAEEVVIGKDVQERTETVQETARRTDVDVQETGGTTSTTGYSGTSTTASTGMAGTSGSSSGQYGGGSATGGGEGTIERTLGDVGSGAERATGVDLDRSGGVGDRDRRDNY